VTLAARRADERVKTIAFGVVAAVFVYTTLANVVERPEGVKIGARLIAAIVLNPSSPASRGPSSCGSPAWSSTT
jgi:hypothetical protein